MPENIEMERCNIFRKDHEKRILWKRKNLTRIFKTFKVAHNGLQQFSALRL